MTFLNRFRRSLVLLVVAAIGANIFSGCVGLRMWEKGKYFSSDRAADFEQRNINTVGIYVFSEGKAVDGSEKPFNGWDVVNSVLSLPLVLFGRYSFGGPQIGVSKYHYPDRVELGSVFEPDTANAGPSIELATALKKELEERGYTAVVVADMPHSGEIPVDRCLKHAKESGYDAAFIVDYVGLKRWTEYAGETTSQVGRTTVVTTHVNTYDGYLYLPNGAMFDVKKNNELLWRTSYYGLVEHAHVPNFSSEPFTQVVNEPVIANGGETYFAAAPKAAKVLLAPTKWADSFKELPLKEGARRRF